MNPPYPICRLRLLIICAMFMLTEAIAAGQTCLLPQWISYGGNSSPSQVWFRQTVIMNGHPRQGSILLITTGYAALYVNGFNVAPTSFSPVRPYGNTDAIATLTDISRYLRADSNTIAVWYGASADNFPQNQIALSFYGTYTSGLPFCFDTDDSWLCRPANVTTMSDASEAEDGRKHSVSWKASDNHTALWTPAGISSSDNSQITFCDSTIRAVSTQTPAHFDIEGDSIVYTFPSPFYGRIRVTMRDAVPGETIHIGSLTYTCSGETDEQASGRFSIQTGRKVIICGDTRFSPGQIQSVEAISYAPSWQPKWK